MKLVSPNYFPEAKLYRKGAVPTDSEYECWCDPCGRYAYKLIFPQEGAAPVADPTDYNVYYGVRDRPCASLLIHLAYFNYSSTTGTPSPNPPGFELWVRMGIDSNASNVFLAQVKPPSRGTMGRIVEISGLTFTQFELFYRVIDGAVPGSIAPLTFQLSVIAADGHVKSPIDYDLGSMTTQLPTPPDP